MNTRTSEFPALEAWSIHSQHVTLAHTDVLRLLSRELTSPRGESRLPWIRHRHPLRAGGAASSVNIIVYVDTVKPLETRHAFFAKHPLNRPDEQLDQRLL